MKKLTLIAVLFSMMTLSSQAQWLDFSSNKQEATIGLNMGVVGYHFDGSHIDKTYAGFGGGVSCSLFGIYVDCIYQSPEHRWGKKIDPIIYNDHTALTINVGYKIPVLPILNIIPMIGYSNETTGWTDCSTINFDYNTYTFYHDYDVEHRYNHFNYGAGISVKPLDWMEVGVVCTAHAIYGNFSVNPRISKE